MTRRDRREGIRVAARQHVVDRRFVCLALLLVACAAPTDYEAAGTASYCPDAAPMVDAEPIPRATDEAACQEVSLTYCSWAATCGTLAEADVPACVATVRGVCCSVAGCGSAEPAHIPTSIVDACTAELEALPCDTPPEAPPPPSCAELAGHWGQP